jgi:hypothetical protein
LREGEQRLGELRERRAELQRFIARIEEVVKEAQSETTLALTKLLERARLLEQDADFDQAIALYEQVLLAAPEQTKVKAQLDKLKAAWLPKNEKHAQARSFLLQTWPRFDVVELTAQLPMAEKALTVCRDAGDRLTPLKVLQANTAHVAQLKKRLDALRRQDSEDSRNQSKTLAQVAEGLRRLHTQALELAGRKSE